MQMTGTSNQTPSSACWTRRPRRPSRAASFCWARPSPGWGYSEHAVAGRCNGSKPRANKPTCTCLPVGLFHTNREVATPSSIFARRLHRRRSRAGSEWVELGIPIEIVAPALVQIVGRERAAVLLQHVGRRLDRAAARVHPALARQPVALAQIAGGAGGHDVGPDRAPAA